MEKNGMQSIEISNVSPEVKRDLTNIAKNEGVSLAQFLKPKLREIRDSYPEKMRQDKSKD